MKRLYAFTVGAVTAVMPRACSSTPPMNQRATSERPSGAPPSSKHVGSRIVPEREVQVVPGGAAAVHGPADERRGQAVHGRDLLDRELQE